MYTPSELSQWSKGKLMCIPAKSGDEQELVFNMPCTGVSIDTRSIRSDEVFFALRGEQVDGHVYVEKAFELGAALCVVEQSWFDAVLNPAAGLYLAVSDVFQSLQDCAREYRKKLGIPVVAITGSNGKTSTKNMIQAVLSTKYKVCATKGNLNNHIGLPLSILSLTPSDQIGVFEIGMNHPGEIKPLAEIAGPQVAVITGIGTAHVEFFEHTDCPGGPKEAIAHEKGELARALSKGGLLVVPGNDTYKDLLVSVAPLARAVTPSLQDSGAEQIVHELQSKDFPYAHAKHMLQNALLAIAVGEEFGILKSDATTALALAKYEKGRFMKMDIVLATTGEVLHIIDDTYNANPDSVCSAISAMPAGTSAGSPRTSLRLLVALGCLKEQGDSLTAGYERIYKTAEESGIAELILCGIDWNPEFDSISTSTTDIKITHVLDHTQCAEYIRSIYEADDLVLFKGSRGSRMEEVIRLLETKPDNK